jgi:hypothetical protein
VSKCIEIVEIECSSISIEVTEMMKSAMEISEKEDPFLSEVKNALTLKELSDASISNIWATSW